MKKNLTELVFILDRSGSMQGLEGDTIGGFNAMIEKQKKEPGEAFVSTVLFDDQIEVLYDRVKVRRGPAHHRQGVLCPGLYRPAGCHWQGYPPHRQHPQVRWPEDVPEAHPVRHHHRWHGKRQPPLLSLRGEGDDPVPEGEIRLGISLPGANIDAVETAGHLGIAPDRAVNYHCDSEGPG